MDTFTAADTLGIVNDGNPIFVICNRIDRAGELTGSL